MGMKTTAKGTRKFTKEEKLAIIEEARTNGVKVTLEKYAIYPATYYYWKKKLTVYGEDGLNHASSRELAGKVKRLEKENEALKLLLAEHQLEGRLKDELLKKKYPELRDVK